MKKETCNVPRQVKKLHGGDISPWKRISSKESTPSNRSTSLYRRRKRGRRTGAKAGGSRLSNCGYSPVMEVLDSDLLDFWWMQLVSLPDKGFSIRISPYGQGGLRWLPYSIESCRVNESPLFRKADPLFARKNCKLGGRRAWTD